VAITVDKYVSVQLENYNGTYSVKEGWINSEGKWSPNFCKRRFKKDGEEKTAPISVRLGDKETALAVLRELAGEIGGEDAPPF
jgi:hypothetical protein